MENARCAPSRVTDKASIRNITFYQFGSWVEVHATARREVVQHANLMTGRQEGINQVRSDETCASSDQHSWHLLHTPHKNLAAVIFVKGDISITPQTVLHSDVLP